MKQLTTTTDAAAALPVSTAVRSHIAASIAPNTHRAYSAALQRVDEFAAGAPITDALLAEFLAARHDAGAAPATLRMAVAAVGFRAGLSNAPSPVGPLTRKTLAGAVRKGVGRGRGQVDGINFGSADAMAAQAGNGGGSKAGLRDAAMLLVASDALLRVSEVAALDVADVDAGDADGDNATVTVRRSKTDQVGDGATLYLRPRTAAAVAAWMDSAGIIDGPLFRSVSKAGTVAATRISARSIRRVIAARAADAGVAGRISGHSLRVGAAQDLVRLGASLPALQQAGRWSSPTMPARYARKLLAAQGAVKQLRPA